MANLIDKTYFVLDINLPKGNFDTIENQITKLEKSILINLLGYDLYLDVISAEISDVAKDIRDGKIYEVNINGVTHKVKWNGLKNAEKESLIAYYIYCEIMRNGVTSTQSVGEVKSKQENSYNASINAKVFSAYVKFEELYGYPGQDKLTPSAYNFLMANKSAYPLWIFKEMQGGINSHDL